MSASTVTDTSGPQRNTLRPLVVIIRVVFYLALSIFAVGVFRILFRSGGILGWNGGMACVKLPDALLPPPLGAAEPPPAVMPSIHGNEYCAPAATALQAFYSTLANGLGLPFFLIAFGLTSRLLTIAAKGGVYKAEVVSRIRFLGWTLLVGEVVMNALHIVGSIHLYDQLVTGHYGGPASLAFLQVNWTVLLTGVVLLTLARILREGVGMREDLEGTI